MQVIGDLKADAITDIIKEQVDESANLITDNSTSYKKLIEHVNATHFAKIVEPEMVCVVLCGVHIVISNAKRLLLEGHS